MNRLERLVDLIHILECRGLLKEFFEFEENFCLAQGREKNLLLSVRNNANGEKEVITKEIQTIQNSDTTNCIWVHIIDKEKIS